MATIILTHAASGARSCDAACYNAHGPRCNCICQGRNHGIGLPRALENNRAFLAQLARDPAVKRISLPGRRQMSLLERLA